MHVGGGKVVGRISKELTLVPSSAPQLFRASATMAEQMVPCPMRSSSLTMGNPTPKRRLKPVRQ